MQGMIPLEDKKQYSQDARHNEVDCALVGKLSYSLRRRMKNYLMRKIKPYNKTPWGVKPNLGFVAIVPREDEVGNNTEWADVWEMSFIARKTVYEDYLAGRNTMFLDMAIKKIGAELGTCAFILVPDEFNKVHSAIAISGPPGPARSLAASIRKKQARTGARLLNPTTVFFSRCEAMIKADHPNASIDTTNVK